MALSAAPICQQAAQTDGALGRPKPATVKLFHSLMNPGGTSAGKQRDWTLRWWTRSPEDQMIIALWAAILRINVSTLVLSVLIILASNPGSASSITA